MSGRGPAGEIHAAFDDAGTARAAVERLHEAGFDSNAIEIRSSTPIERIEDWPGVRLRSRARWVAILGALLGGVSAFLVASLTAWDYPIVTGGMPIVAPMPVGIITYEFVALGAILFTVLCVVVEGRLRPRLRPAAGPLDAHVSEGRVLLRVAGCRPGDASIRAALQDAAEIRESYPAAP